MFLPCPGCQSFAEHTWVGDRMQRRKHARQWLPGKGKSQLNGRESDAEMQAHMADRPATGYGKLKKREWDRHIHAGRAAPLSELHRRSGLAWPSLATLLPLVAVICSLRSWMLCTPTDRQHRLSRALMTSLRRQFPTAKLVFSELIRSMRLNGTARFGVDWFGLDRMRWSWRNGCSMVGRADQPFMLSTPLFRVRSLSAERSDERRQFWRLARRIPAIEPCPPLPPRRTSLATEKQSSTRIPRLSCLR